MTIYGFTNGDAIREQVLKFRHEPLAYVYATAIILIFFSSLAQIYVALFINQYETHIEEQEEIEQKKQELKNLLKIKSIIKDSADDNNYSQQASEFMDYMHGKKDYEGSKSSLIDQDDINLVKDDLKEAINILSDTDIRKTELMKT